MVRSNREPKFLGRIISKGESSLKIQDPYRYFKVLGNVGKVSRYLFVFVFLFSGILGIVLLYRHKGSQLRELVDNRPKLQDTFSIDVLSYTGIVELLWTDGNKTSILYQGNSPKLVISQGKDYTPILEVSLPIDDSNSKTTSFLNKQQAYIFDVHPPIIRVSRPGEERFFYFDVKRNNFFEALSIKEDSWLTTDWEVFYPNTEGVSYNSRIFPVIMVGMLNAELDEFGRGNPTTVAQLRAYSYDTTGNKYVLVKSLFIEDNIVSLSSLGDDILLVQGDPLTGMYMVLIKQHDLLGLQNQNVSNVLDTSKDQNSNNKERLNKRLSKVHLFKGCKWEQVRIYPFAGNIVDKTNLGFLKRRLIRVLSPHSSACAESGIYILEDKNLYKVNGVERFLDSVYQHDLLLINGADMGWGGHHSYNLYVLIGVVNENNELDIRLGGLTLRHVKNEGSASTNDQMGYFEFQEIRQAKPNILINGNSFSLNFVPWKWILDDKMLYIGIGHPYVYLRIQQLPVLTNE